MGRVFDRWPKWPVWARALSILALVSAGVLVLGGIGWFQYLQEMFNRLPAVAQGIVLSVLVVVALVVLGFSIHQGMQKSDLNAESERLKKELALATERWDRLQLVETQSSLWWNPCQIAVPPFVPAVQRRTRFVCMLNLKGGVGKTTLTANLAAGLGLTGGCRVLLVDLDFQGTLGEVAADPAFKKDRLDREDLVHQFLRLPQFDETVFRRLQVPVFDVPQAKVVMANDRLDTDDFQQQARFFVNPQADPRYRFRTHLHRTEVFDQFDVVLFDCPPRVTTSVVNALFCSDYILIPTTLDAGSIEAVPRMLLWIKRFGALCPASGVGVIPMRVGLHRGQVVSAEKNNYVLLRKESSRVYNSDVVWDNFVPDSSAAVSQARGRIASLKPAGRKVFERVVEEFRKRVLS